jgi:hypothetical protein
MEKLLETIENVGGSIKKQTKNNKLLFVFEFLLKSFLTNDGYASLALSSL